MTTPRIQSPPIRVPTLGTPDREVLNRQFPAARQDRAASCQSPEAEAVMGARNPDRIPDEEWIGAYPTIERMIEGGWELRAKCELCSLKLNASLALFARLLGPKFTLWGHTRACPREGCTGRVCIKGKPPQRSVWFDISRTA